MEQKLQYLIFLRYYQTPLYICNLNTFHKICNPTATSNGKDDITMCYGIQKYLVANMGKYNVPVGHNQIPLWHLLNTTQLQNFYLISSCQDELCNRIPT